MTNDTRYADVNDGTTFPAITSAEATRALTLLVREFGKPKDAAPRSDINGEPKAPRPLAKTNVPDLWTDRHGYRRVWVSPKPTVGHHKGWGRLVHDVSHMVHRYRNPYARSHEGDHHRLEAEIMAYVKASGWLTGTLRPAPKAKPTRDDRRAALEARLARWQSKERRAATAIRKIKRKLARMELVARRLDAIKATPILGDAP
jgi:hypothetical protein